MLIGEVASLGFLALQAIKGLFLSDFAELGSHFCFVRIFVVPLQPL